MNISIKSTGILKSKVIYWLAIGTCLLAKVTRQLAVSKKVLYSQSQPLLANTTQFISLIYSLTRGQRSLLSKRSLLLARLLICCTLNLSKSQRAVSVSQSVRLSKGNKYCPIRNSNTRHFCNMTKHNLDKNEKNLEIEIDFIQISWIPLDGVLSSPV